MVGRLKFPVLMSEIPETSQEVFLSHPPKNEIIFIISIRFSVLSYKQMLKISKMLLILRGKFGR